MNKFVALFIAMLIFAGTGFADLYVTEQGAGARNGLDWANAYQGLPATLQRGQTYYIADGSYTGYYEFDDEPSGTTLITVKKATSDNHGTNIGWDPAFGDGQALFNTWKFETSYWLIDGQVGGGPGSWESGLGFKLIHPADNSLGIIGNNATSNLSNITIKHVEITANSSISPPPQTGVYWPQPASNITFSYCWLHDIPGDVFQIRNFNNFTVEYCKISRNYQDASNHGDVFEHDGTGANFIFRYNFFDDAVGTYIIGHHTTGDLDGVDVYGNIFYWPFEWRFTDNGSIATLNPGNGGKIHNLKVFNNTFVNMFSGLNSGINMYTGGNNNVVYNNIFYVKPGASVSISFAGVTHNNNWFFNAGTQSEPNIQIGSGDPFVSIANKDFRLTQATAQGLALQSPFNKDMMVNTRGVDGVWDRGAIEFTDGPPPSDTTAPFRSGGSPSGILSTGTSNATLSLVTNENATCKYSTSPGVSFTSMTNTFSSTGGTTHNSSVSGLVNGQGYTYYVKCRDSAGNVNPDDFTISFSVASSPQTTATVSPPTVSVTEGQNGTITFSHNGNTQTALTINYVIGGSAQVTDYDRPTTSSITIPVGTNSQTVSIRTIDDQMLEQTETITLTISPSAFYTTNAQNSVTINILDNDASNSGGLEVGDVVEVTANPDLRVRDNVGTNFPVTGKQSFGALGRIVSGPQTAEGYTWWQIDYDVNVDGWSIEGDTTTKWLTKKEIVAPPQQFTLTIAKQGNGTINGSGINCGTDCSETLNTGTQITLTASAAQDSTFNGWSGSGCSGTGNCTITLNTNTTVSANFTPNTTPISGLVGHWKFDEGTGTTASDSSGNSNSAFLRNGATWTTGKIGSGAISCDGINDFIEVNNSTSLNSSSISVGGWVNKRTNLASGFGIIFGRQFSTSSNDTYFAAYNASTNDEYLSGVTTTVEDVTGATISSTPDLGNWIHYTITYDATTLKQYRNGILINQKTHSNPGNLASETTKHTMCAQYNGPGKDLGIAEFSNTYLDDVRIYNKALTATEVKALFDETDTPQNPPKCTNVLTNIPTTLRNTYGCPLPIATKFDIKPDFNALDITALTNLELGISTYGKISYSNQNLTLIRETNNQQDRLDLDTAIDISQGKIIFNSTTLPELNKPATITMYNINSNYKILKDGVECTTCTIVSYNSSTKVLVFTVQGFSTYEVVQDDGGDDPGSETDGSTSGDTGGAGGGGGGGGGGTGSEGYKASTRNMEITPLALNTAASISTIVSHAIPTPQNFTLELKITQNKSTVHTDITEINNLPTGKAQRVPFPKTWTPTQNTEYEVTILLYKDETLYDQQTKKVTIGQTQGSNTITDVNTPQVKVQDQNKPQKLWDYNLNPQKDTNASATGQPLEAAQIGIILIALVALGAAAQGIILIKKGQ